MKRIVLLASLLVVTGVCGRCLFGKVLVVHDPRIPAWVLDARVHDDALWHTAIDWSSDEPSLPRFAGRSIVLKCGKGILQLDLVTITRTLSGGAAQVRVWQRPIAWIPGAVPIAGLVVTTCFLWVRPLLRRGARRLRGLCEACGYRTLGLSNGRCPECGKTLPSGTRESP